MGIIERITDGLNRTKAELPAMAIAGGIILGVGAAYLTNWKEQCYPLQFSERTQIEQDAKQSGKAPSPSTLYHADALDIAMKVFEANNKGIIFPSDKELHFAEALKDKYKETRFHYNLDGLTERFEKDVQNLRGQLESLYSARPIVASAESGLNSAWKHTSKAQYLPVPETYTVSVGSGKNRHTEMRTRIALKHVWTDHEYDLNKDNAQAAANSLKNLQSKSEADDAGIARPSKINDPNKQAILDSRKQADEKDKTSENEAYAIGKSWGSNAKIPGIINSAWREISHAQNHLGDLEGCIRKAPVHAKSRTYTPAAALATKGTLSSMTVGSFEGSSSHPPEGYEFYNGYKDNLGKIAKDLNAAESIWKESNGIVSQIRAKLEALSQKQILSEEDKRLAGEVRELSEQLIEKNFSDGIKVPSKRWYVPVLWGLLGALVGGALGLAVDRGAEAYGLKQKDPRRKFRCSAYTRDRDLD